MRKFKIIGISVLMVMILMILVSCATLGIGQKSWAERTPAEKSLAILEAYNTQFADTMRMALRKDLSETEKQLVRSKKVVLKEVKPLIEVYVAIVEAGGIPSSLDERKIMEYIEKLGGKL